ncbi:hypothetical protein F4808DRAFT_454689 [Astrocystis sublimbata]|nr:hypothetical protein F4808DRAFT_454689 [Astrocystis sublimbata]
MAGYWWLSIAQKGACGRAPAGPLAWAVAMACRTGHAGEGILKRLPKPTNTMSTSSAALAQLKQFNLASRSLFVKCAPAPRTFYERRAVLAALQHTSEHSIEVFKKLEDSGSFIAVTTEPEAAKLLLDSSPLERTIPSQNPHSDTVSLPTAFGVSYSDMSGAIADPIHPLPADDAAAMETPASAELGLAYHTFTLKIFSTSKDYSHPEEIAKNPLHGPWPSPRSPKPKIESFTSAALQRVMPSGAMAPALRDWDTGNQLARDGDSFADDGPDGAAATLLGNKRHSAREAFFLERIRRRDGAQKTPKVMEGLFKFADECRAEAEAKAAAAEAEAQSSESAKNAASNDDQVKADSKSTSASPGDTNPDTLHDDASFKKLLDDGQP